MNDELATLPPTFFDSRLDEIRKVLPEADDNGVLKECPCASCCVVRTAIAHGTLQQPEVGSTDWMDELRAEATIQEQKRDAFTQDDKWYHWHDGVAFGIKTALQHSGAGSSIVRVSHREK